jgi:hypothetical protein
MAWMALDGAFGAIKSGKTFGYFFKAKDDGLVKSRHSGGSRNPGIPLLNENTGFRHSPE